MLVEQAAKRFTSARNFSKRTEFAGFCKNSPWCLGADSNHRHADFQSGGVARSVNHLR